MDELTQNQAPEPNYTPPDYIIETATDPEGIHACVKFMLPHRRYRMNLPLGLLLLVIGPSLIAMDETALGIVGLVVGIYSLIFYLTFPARVAQKQVARLEESYGTDTVECQLVFWPQGVVINNRRSGGSAKFRYDIIRSLARNGDFLTFRTTENQSVILRLTDIPEDDRDAFIEYLKNHCPHAKRIGL